MKKSFAVVTNPLYNPPKKVVDDSIKAFRKIMDKNKDMREEALASFPAKSRNKSMNQYAEAAVRTMLKDYKAFQGDPIQYFNMISKNLLRSDKLMLTGEELPAVFRKLLGEEKNIRAEVNCLNYLASFIIVHVYFFNPVFMFIFYKKNF